jgi:hypothetical protein
MWCDADSPFKNPDGEDGGLGEDIDTFVLATVVAKAMLRRFRRAACVDVLVPRIKAGPSEGDP